MRRLILILLAAAGAVLTMAALVAGARVLYDVFGLVSVAVVISVLT